MILSENRLLQISGHQLKFLNFLTKTYIMGTQKNH